MAKRPPEPDRVALLQGTLDMLVLQTLSWGPLHGHGIAVTIQRQSGDTLLVDHGSLYPALERLQSKRWITTTPGALESGRKVRQYKLTTLGRRQLTRETSKWARLTEAIARILVPMPVKE
jgi:transcriptional regulator